MTRDALVVMARAPIPGRSKSRLAAEVGPWRAAKIYSSILRSVLPRLASAGSGWDAFVYVAAAAEGRWFERRFPGYQVIQQSGHTLGDRLAHAFEACFLTGAPRVVVVGSDVPELTTDHVFRALEALARADVVLGPSPDGGYYLVGQNSPGRPIFEGIPWSTGAVLRATLDRCREVQASTTEIEPLMDVDTAADWRRVQDRQRVL